MNITFSTDENKVLCNIITHILRDRKLQANSNSFYHVTLHDITPNELQALSDVKDKLVEAASHATKQSPIMRQWTNLKEKHPDALLLFRCGDFYETYKEDAVQAAKILGITLTKRNYDGLQMTGFPHHALDTYLPKLIRKGCRVAICDQLEPVKKH